MNTSNKEPSREGPTPEAKWQMMDASGMNNGIPSFLVFKGDFDWTKAEKPEHALDRLERSRDSWKQRAEAAERELSRVNNSIVVIASGQDGTTVRGPHKSVAEMNARMLRSWYEDEQKRAGDAETKLEAAERRAGDAEQAYSALRKEFLAARYQINHAARAGKVWVTYDRKQIDDLLSRMKEALAAKEGGVA